MTTNPFDHAACVERLPWFLAGSCDDEEAARIAEHLAGCAACRRELAETRAAAAFFAAEHPSSEVLVASVHGELSVADDAALRAHFRECAACAEQLALAEASAVLERKVPDGHVARGSGAGSAPKEVSRRRSPLLALAASLAVLAGALGLWSAWTTRGLAERTRERLAAAEAEVHTATSGRRVAERELARERERTSELLRRLEMSSAPRGGVAVVELLAESTLRGGAAAPTTVVRGETLELTLLLALPAQRSASWVIEARSGDDGELLWSVSGLRAAANGALALVVPAERLPVGEVFLELAAEGSKQVAARYRLDVR